MKENKTIQKELCTSNSNQNSVHSFPTLYFDFDGVISNTIQTICNLYNQDFKYYKNFRHINWEDINTYDFSECNCATSDYINTYFNQQRFFDNIFLMPMAKHTLKKLSHAHNIYIVSSGYSPNLKGKEIWIKENLPFCKFIEVNLKAYKDKSHIDMSDGIFVDDTIHNLITSNAKEKICFGRIYNWNKNWEGKRCLDWKHLWEELNS